MSTPLATVEVDADALARVLTNVSLVAKKNARYPTARVQLHADGITVMGTDEYCAAVDACPGEYQGPTEGVTLEIPRDALEALEKAARPDKRYPVKLEWFPGDGLVLNASVGRESARDAGRHDDVWQFLADLFALPEDAPFQLDGPSAVDMRLLARFWRVRASNGEAVADLMYTGAESPILIKMGATFRGLVMPIKRERFAEKAGQDGLW